MSETSQTAKSEGAKQEPTQSITLVMPAVIEVRVGDRMKFTPGIGAKTGDDFSFREFIAKYDDQECSVVGLPEVREKKNAPPDGPEEAMLNLFQGFNDMHPRFMLKFDDGHERKIKSVHLTALPKRNETPYTVPSGERDMGGISAYSAATEGEQWDVLKEGRHLAGLRS